MTLIELIMNVFSLFFNTTIIIIIAVGSMVVVKEFNLDFYFEHCKNRLKDVIENMDTIVWPSIFDDIGDSIYCVDEEESEEESEKSILKDKKYEDKYLDVVRQMPNEVVFTDIELEMLNIHKREFYRAITDKYINNISDLKNKIDDLKLEISVFKEYDVTEQNKDTMSTLISSNGVKNFEKDIETYNNEINELERRLNDKNEIEHEALEEAKKIIINERYDKLINSFVIEKTPLGNVLMFYNNKRGTFEYYSDNTIPYRYLEVVGRKYVKMFHCRSLYFDMEEEMRKYEEKVEKQQQMQRLEDEEKKNKKDTLQNNSNPNKDKKNVFAKFKSYNKEAGTGHVSMGGPQKNNVVNTQPNHTKLDKLVLKENANRYTHEGKLCNFSFVKKIPRKAVDKKYALTFAEFKKMNGRL